MDWDNYLMGFAKHAATKSKDTTKVGAILVGNNREVRMSGFNGPPIGVYECDARRERPTKYLFTSHAEQNVVALAAKVGIPTEGCTLYTTHLSCSACARSIIQAGIKCVVVGQGEFNSASSIPEEHEATLDMFNEAGVEVRYLG